MSRTDYTGYWHDGLGRAVVTAEYGNQGNDSAAAPRDFDDTAPIFSDTILVTFTIYDDAGNVFITYDPSARQDQMEYDDAGRVTKTSRNYVDGLPASGAGDKDVTVEFTYNADGNLATLSAK